MTEYLQQAQIGAIEQAVLTLLGYDPATRSALLAGIPVEVRAIMPGSAGGALPGVALTLDLAYLNTAGRLRDGTVLIKVWLQNVLKFIGTAQAADPVREALADVEAATTGAPRPAIAVAAIVKEKLVLQDDMVTFRFMEAGVEAARAVAKLVVPRYDGGAPRLQGITPLTYLGTGWLLGGNLLITNHHVVNARDEGESDAGRQDLDLQIAGMQVLFDYDADGRAGSPATTAGLVAFDSALDYAVVRIDAGGRKPLELAPQPILKSDDRTALAVNIIQHPDGKPKRYGIRNNLVNQATAAEVQYFTDTLSGSSGAPVMDDLWQVVALHRGSSFAAGVKFQGREVPYVNVGTPLTAILADLRKRYAGTLPELGI